MRYLFALHVSCVLVCHGLTNHCGCMLAAAASKIGRAMGAAHAIEAGRLVALTSILHRRPALAGDILQGPLPAAYAPPTYHQ